MIIELYNFKFKSHILSILYFFLTNIFALLIITSLSFLDKKSNVQNDIEDWSPQTRRKVITVLIRMLNEAGMLENNKLVQIEAPDEFWRMFVANNDSWFLEAGLLSKEQRENIING